MLNLHTAKRASASTMPVRVKRVYVTTVEGGFLGNSEGCGFDLVSVAEAWESDIGDKGVDAHVRGKLGGVGVGPRSGEDGVAADDVVCRARSRSGQHDSTLAEGDGAAFGGDAAGGQRQYARAGREGFDLPRRAPLQDEQPFGGEAGGCLRRRAAAGGGGEAVAQSGAPPGAAAGASVVVGVGSSHLSRLH
jgi:hypothetical protein